MLAEASLSLAGIILLALVAIVLLAIPVMVLVKLATIDNEWRAILVAIAIVAIAEVILRAIIWLGGR